MNASVSHTTAEQTHCHIERIFGITHIQSTLILATATTQKPEAYLKMDLGIDTPSAVFSNYEFIALLLERKTPNSSTTLQRDHHYNQLPA